jgi:hypothetical protein
VQCQRPPKGIFFTVWPETEKPWKNRSFYFLLELEGRDPYIVAPEIAKKKKDEEDTIRRVLVVRYVTMAGEEGLWPLKLNPPDGKSNPWNTSALNILALAEEGWVRIVNLEEALSASVLEQDPRGCAAAVLGSLFRRIDQRCVQGRSDRCQSRPRNLGHSDQRKQEVGREQRSGNRLLARRHHR